MVTLEGSVMEILIIESWGMAQIPGEIGGTWHSQMPKDDLVIGLAVCDQSSAI